MNCNIQNNIDSTNTTIMQNIYNNKDIIEQYASQNKSEFRNYINTLFKESLKDLTKDEI